MTKSLTYCEVDVDYCSLTYGFAPCQAFLEGGVTRSHLTDSHFVGWTTNNGYLNGGDVYAYYDQSGGGDTQLLSPTLSINGAVDYIVRVELVRATLRTAGSWEGVVFYSTGGHGYSGSYYKQIAEPAALQVVGNAGVIEDRVILEWDMSSLTAGGNDWITNTITGIRFDFDTQDSAYRIFAVVVGHYATADEATGSHKCFNTKFTCQDPAHYTEVGATLRFAKNVEYLPKDIDAIPSITDVKFTPGIVSLGEDLGQRATLEVEFRDHKHPDSGTGYDKYYDERGYDPYEQGTHWGRFRTRHPFLQSKGIRLIRGLLGDALADMDTRSYVIENIEGPSYDGVFSIVGKDVLKLADGDRAQAPGLSGGSLLAAITPSDNRMTLTPTGIGAEYGDAGYMNISEEIVSYIRLEDAYFLGHFDGADGATAATDSSAAGHVITFGGNAQLDTAQFKFGTASLLVDNSGDFARLDGSNDFAFGTGDFRIDLQVRLNNTGTTKPLIDFRNGVNDVAPVININTSNVLIAAIGNSIKITGTTALTTGTWYQVTLSRVSGTMRLFLNGTQEGSSYASAESLVVGSGRPSIGSQYDLTTSANSWIDEVRIIKGSGVSANFTAPVAAYTLTKTDVFAIFRAQYNTVAADHEATDRAQVCVVYNGEDPADIVYDLLVNYANVSASYITLADWQAETANFYGSLFTTLIAEPTDVDKLLSEIMDLGFAIWWDDLEQKIHFQVLRQIPTTAATYTDDDRIAHTLKIKEQPEKRLTQVWTYFARRNPLLNLDQLENYRSIAKTTDATAETDYGVPAIRKRFTRWIPEGGSAIAEASNQALLSRYRDPPRRFNFDLFRRYDPLQDPTLGAGYQLEAWCLQDETGAREAVPIQVTRLNPDADRFKIEAEEMRYTAAVADPTARVIILDADTFDINLRTLHDTLYTAPENGDTVTLIIQNGVIVGSSSRSTPALDIGSWPAGVTITLEGTGRIQGHGGNGSGIVGFTTMAAEAGGTALYTRYAINIGMSGGQIWGGGGGGGIFTTGGSYYAGGGGAGTLPGAGGLIPGSNQGSSGTSEDGGAGGFGIGGSGGDPGTAGTNGNVTNGGAAGNAIDGVSYCTISSPAPNLLGGQVN